MYSDSWREISIGMSLRRMQCLSRRTNLCTAKSRGQSRQIDSSAVMINWLSKRARARRKRSHITRPPIRYWREINFIDRFLSSVSDWAVVDVWEPEIYDLVDFIYSWKSENEGRKLRNEGTWKNRAKRIQQFFLSISLFFPTLFTLNQYFTKNPTADVFRWKKWVIVPSREIRQLSVGLGNAEPPTSEMPKIYSYCAGEVRRCINTGNQATAGLARSVIWEFYHHLRGVFG